ncbi:protein MpHD9 [Marchantia polymorpha subsp. ruderalis]
MGLMAMAVQSASFCSFSTRPPVAASAWSEWRGVPLRREIIGLVKFGIGKKTLQVVSRRGGGGGRGGPAKPRNVSPRGRSVQQQQQEALPKSLIAKKTRQEEEDEEDALAEAALEALFAQLEKDLEDGAMSEDDDDDEDFTEEEVIALEDELEAALLGLDYEQQTVIDSEAGKSEVGPSQSKRLAKEDAELILDDEEEDEEEQRVVSLETWQLKKLAAAAEIGRRNINVKALAAEVGMDRSDVLAWLKNPPPELLMLGATMGLEEDSKDADQVNEESEDAASRTPAKISTSTNKQIPESQGFAPETWYNQKRLKKEHVATFERVFRRTKRPTNAMIQNLVELTHVPRKRIVEWFDHKRQELDPSQRLEPLR